MSKFQDCRIQQVEHIHLQEMKDYSEQQHRTSSFSTTSATNDAATTKNLSSSPAVAFWRFILLLVLLAGAVSTATIIHRYATRQQQNEFNQSYMNNGNKCLEFIQSNIFDTLRSADSMVIDILSYANSTNQTWPFVTTPHFAERASRIESLSKAVVMNLYHVVSSEQRHSWEHYTALHHQWVDDIISFQATDVTFTGPIITNYTTYNVIHDYDELEKPRGVAGTVGTNRTPPYFMPMWQSYPVIPTYPPYNWDLWSSTNITSGIVLMETMRVVITEAYMIPDYNDPIQLQETMNFAQWFEPYVKPGENPMEPVSDIYYPIFDQLEIQTASTKPSRDNTSVLIGDDHYDNFYTGIDNVNYQPFPIVGIFAMSIYWRDMMKGILPTNSNGLHVVFTNPCNPTFTYEINGPDVVYLGIGDLHHPKYDAMAIMPMELSTSPNDYYVGVPIQVSYCPFTLHVYPSMVMESSYMTNSPVYFTISALLIFAFTSVVFFIYHVFVERRQHQTVLYAIQSSVNASQLEKLVEERTSTLLEMNDKLESANRHIQNASLQQLEHFACMSHEIRTPLNGINGLTSVIQDDMKQIVNLLATKKQEQYLDKITSMVTSSLESISMVAQSGDYLRTIVDDVLDFAKLGSGKVQIAVQINVNLQHILDTVIRSIESMPLVDTKYLSIETYYHPAVHPFLTTDSRRLQQILYNLLGNAIKFSRDYGTVELHVYPETISSSLRTAVNNECVNTDANYNLCFLIKDYGKGIAKDKFQSIFEPFIQAEGARTEIKHGGTGLGLAITSRLIDALGGSVTVDSELHQWTEFSVRFPISANMNDVVVKGDGNFGRTMMGVGDDIEMAPEPSNSKTFLATSTEVNKDPWKQAADDLQNALIYFVDTNHSAIVERSLQYFKLKHYAYHSVEALECNMQLQASNDNLDIIIFLIQEDLLTDSLCRRLSCYHGQKNKIIAFGPNVNNAFDERLVQCKLPSLMRLLPSVLIMKMSECLQVVMSESNTSTISNPIVDPDSNIKNLRILIAEDNRINQKVLLKILDRLQIRNVVIVENGQLAVEQEAMNPFDVVFMDLHMPIMNGVDACKLITTRQRIVTTPLSYHVGQASVTPHHPIPSVVFLTAHVSPAFQKECYQAGAIGYLTKPCNIDSIASFLRNLNIHDTS